jgi:hypothetical protein
MSDKQILVGDLLKIKGFDPMNVDVTYIKQVMNLIPKNGSLDMNEAERLATKFLACADYCGELLSQAIRFLGHTDATKKSERASSIERKIAGKTPATTAKETYSNDPLYIDAAEKNTDAQAFLTWIQQKYENLIKAHVLCKDLMKSHAQNRTQSSWEGVDEEVNKPSPTPQKEEDGDIKADDFDIDVG